MKRAVEIKSASDEEKLKHRAEFLEQKRKRREAEALTTEQMMERAREILSTPASQEFFRKRAEEVKNKAK